MTHDTRKRSAGELGLTRKDCVCDPMDLAALGHMLNCPAHAEVKSPAMIAGSAAHAAITKELISNGEVVLDGEGQIVDLGTVEVKTSSRQAGKTAEMERRLTILPDGLPDRLCIERNSRFGSAATSCVGVRLDGSEEDSGDVVEYCVSERWVWLGVRGEDGHIRRDPNKRPYGLLTTLRTNVSVEPYWRVQPSRQVRRAMARGK